MKKLFKYSIFLIIPMLLLSPLAVLAVDGGGLQGAQQNLKDVGKGAYGTDKPKDLPVLVGEYINIFLGLLGIILVILLVYGGYLWMTSMGSQEKTTKAKTLITDAVIGLIIVLAAYAISNFVITQLINATTGA